MSKNFYITTTLPYVNSDPHIGFAMELVRADVVARSKKLQDFDVFFNTGTDEHGQKLFTGAKEAGRDIKEYVDLYAEKFKSLPKALGVLEGIHFIRTTDENHVKAAQEFWKRCDDNGFIYKKNYQTKYCVGCELEKTDSELVDGRCPLHPNREIEIRDEENYFFKFSEFQDKLLKFYETNPNFVIPDFRYNEIKSFVERGLEDFSISRLKEKMSWGVPVPNDPDHVMYVWFDALVSYISTLGWPENEDNFKKYWEEGTPVQYCGKDNLRQQSAMWQAMLMAAGLPNTKQIVINGFIMADGGTKMSKSLGNTVDPYELVNEYGTDAVRYFLLRELSNFEDSPFTTERFKNAYNAGLANGLGNLVSRIMKMAESYDIKAREVDLKNFDKDFSSEMDISDFINKYEISKAVEAIWSKITETDTLIQTDQAFKLIKTNRNDAEICIKTYIQNLIEISFKLRPFLPETSMKIENLIKENKSPETPLFLRKD
ncbi:MAG TPA: methionine--tRNA ligase [Candidatus Paceibacterota bacterium]